MYINHTTPPSKDERLRDPLNPNLECKHYRKKGEGCSVLDPANECTLKILLKAQGEISRGENVNRCINSNKKGPLFLHYSILPTQTL